MTEPLPPVTGAGADRLARRSVRYWNIRTILIAAMTIAVALAADALVDLGPLAGVPWAVASLAVVAGLVDTTVLNRLRFANSSYTATESYVYIANGRIVRKSVTIATPHILNVVVLQGPVLRAMGLAGVRFTNLVESDVLGPVTPEEAERIRSVVLRSVHGSATADRSER